MCLRNSQVRCARPETLAQQDAEATYLWWRLSRRAYADIAREGSFTAGDLDDVWSPSSNWDECLTLARKALGSQERKMLDAMGFVQVACLKIRESSVTGNPIIDDRKYWPVKP